MAINSPSQPDHVKSWSNAYLKHHCGLYDAPHSGELFPPAFFESRRNVGRIGNVTTNHLDSTIPLTLEFGHEIERPLVAGMTSFARDVLGVEKMWLVGMPYLDVIKAVSSEDFVGREMVAPMWCAIINAACPAAVAAAWMSTD